MRCRRDGNAIVCDIEPVIKARRIYVAEFVLQYVGGHVCHVEENSSVRSSCHFPKHRPADLVTRQQFVDESLASIIYDVGAFATQGFSQKKSWSASQTQNGRMKLHELHISQFCTRAIGGSEA